MKRADGKRRNRNRPKMIIIIIMNVRIFEEETTPNFSH